MEPIPLVTVAMEPNAVASEVMGDIDVPWVEPSEEREHNRPKNLYISESHMFPNYSMPEHSEVLAVFFGLHPVKKGIIAPFGAEMPLRWNTFSTVEKRILTSSQRLWLSTYQT